MREFIPDYTMTMTSSLKYNGWFILWCIICILILMKVYHTKDLKTSAGKEILEEHYKSLGHITGKEKRGIILVLILLVYLCSTRITGLPAAYGFMVISVLVFLPGIGIGNEGTVKKINFLCHLVWKLVLRELPLDSEISLHQLRYLHYREKECCLYVWHLSLSE